MTTILPPQERERVRRTPGSYADYLALPGDARLIEWKDGEIIEYMPPSNKHQRLIRFLSSLLGDYAELLELGVVQVSPFEVRLWPDGPSREPDLFFVSRDRLALLGRKSFAGGPDLVVEIISTSSSRTDRVEKFIEYEQAGVREYWLIDPRFGKEQADFYQRDADNRFASVALDENGVYTSVVLPGFRLTPASLWREPLPYSQLVLAELVKDHPTLPADLRAAYAALYEALKK